jgi:hypothetical protein
VAPQGAGAGGAPELSAQAMQGLQAGQLAAACAACDAALASRCPVCPTVQLEGLRCALHGVPAVWDAHSNSRLGACSPSGPHHTTGLETGAGLPAGMVQLSASTACHGAHPWFPHTLRGWVHVHVHIHTQSTSSQQNKVLCSAMHT